MKLQHLIGCLIISFLACQIAVIADDSPIDPSKTIADQQLTATITGMRGMVQVRLSDDEPWQKATIGMKLNAGATFRTGPRSAVQFKIPPDQTITLDRLGTIKLLTAVAENNKIKTDLGMTYGRTRYDIRKAGFEHESTIRSPSATLSVRGTRVGIQDGASGFQAWSTQSRAQLFDQTRRRSFSFGDNTEMGNHTNGPADNMERNGTVDPGDGRGRDGGERTLVINQPGLNPNHGGSGNDIFHNRSLPNGPAGQLPTGLKNSNTELYGVGDLRFELSWTAYGMENYDYGYADLDLAILAPLAEGGFATSGVSTNPSNSPFLYSTTGDGSTISIDTDLGTNGNAKSSYGNTATEAITFYGIFPLDHGVAVTNQYSNTPAQNYTLTILGKLNGSLEFTELETIDLLEVDSGMTNIHAITVTPTGDVFEASTVGVIDNSSLGRID